MIVCDVFQPTAAPDVLLAEAGSGNRIVRYAVAGHPNCPEGALWRLAGDPDRGVRRMVAAHTTSTPRVFAKLMAPGLCVDETYRWVAGNPAAPPRVLGMIAESGDVPVAGVLLANPSTPLGAKRRLLRVASVADRRRAASLDGADERFLDVLSGDDCDSVRCAVASNPASSPATLMRLAADPLRCVRRCVADNWDAPGPVLTFLASDVDVAAFVAHNPNAPPAALRTVAAVEGRDRAVLAGVLRNVACPRDVVASVERRALTDDVLRLALLGNRYAPSVVFAPPSGGGVADWARLVATNPACPPGLLAAAARGSRECRGNVAANVACPVTVQERLASDVDDRVRWRLATNPQCHADSFATLAGDVSAAVRGAVAAAPAPPGVLRSLACDGDDDVRDAVAANSKAPGDVLERFATSPRAGVRGLVAANPATPEGALAGLCGDVAAVVRGAVGANAARRRLAGVLARLASDPNEWLRRESRCGAP